MRRLRVAGAKRQVLGHSLDEPQRHAERAAVLIGDVELKRVDDLVAEHVIGIRQARGERQDDAALAGVGEAAGALVDEAAVNVGLFEAAVRAVEHDRLPAAQRVLERHRQAARASVRPCAPRAPPRPRLPVSNRCRSGPWRERARGRRRTEPCCARSTARRRRSPGTGTTRLIPSADHQMARPTGHLGSGGAEGAAVISRVRVVECSRAQASVRGRARVSRTDPAGVLESSGRRSSNRAGARSSRVRARVGRLH